MRKVFRDGDAKLMWHLVVRQKHFALHMIRLPRSTRRIGHMLATLACVVGLSSCSSAGDASSVAKNRGVLLVPQMNAGWAGWCLAELPAGGCARGKSRPPVIAETWTSEGPPAVTFGYVLTTSQVISVSIDGGSPIPTRTEAALPDGLRGVVVEIPGLNLETADARPRVKPLNQKGETIAQPAGRPRQMSPGILGLEVPTRSLTNPARPTSGACRISSTPLTGLKIGGGSVITRVTSYSGLLGQGFISCASTSYSLDGWPILAGMFLNASHPGMTPASLPAMQPLSGHPGVFQALSSEGEMLARRIPGAWLAVVKGQGLTQRLTLLEHLSATVHI
jgi:hypothetical protein